MLPPLRISEWETSCDGIARCRSAIALPKGLPHTLPSKYFPAVDTGQTRHSRTIFLFQYRAIVRRAQRNMFLDVCLTICLGSLDRLLSASVRPVSEVTPAELLPALHPHPPQCVDDAP